MELKDVVIVSGVRTPIGRFGGGFKYEPVYDLGAHAIKHCLERAGVKGEQVDEVVLGSCRQAGNGPNPGRTASVRGGVPQDVPVHTINMACPSGMKAVSVAAQAILLGDSEIVVAGGMDSMSTIPYLLKNCRWDGFKMGNSDLEDGWSDSIDPLVGYGMGMTAENLVEKYNITREEMDALALESHKKAAQAWEKGWFNDEVVPYEVASRGKRQPGYTVDKDETIRANTTLEQLGKLRAAFKTDGCVTAGNACSMSDGAVALLVMPRAKAKELGLQPMFSIVAYAQAAVDPALMGEGPGIAIPKALKRAGMELSDMDLLDVNEAFAAQVLANKRMLNWDDEKVNVHGGAIALGHPTGISGARIMLTLAHALKIRDKEIGIASICGGGGVTMATIIKREF